jgi:hypothetical protein
MGWIISFTINHDSALYESRMSSVLSFFYTHILSLLRFSLHSLHLSLIHAYRSSLGYRVLVLVYFVDLYF